MANPITPSTPTPDAHLSLTDSASVTVDVVVKSLQNVKVSKTETVAMYAPDPTAISVVPIETEPIKTASGDITYSDLPPQYSTITQRDWSGGRGNNDFEADRSRYYDASAVEPTEAGLVLGPAPHYTAGLRTADQQVPSRYRSAITLTGANRLVAASFAASASYTPTQAALWLRKVGTPGTLKIEVRTNTAGEPSSTVVTSSEVTAAALADTLWVEQVFTLAGGGLTGSTTYWVVVYGAATDDATNHWELLYDTQNSGLKSTAGVTWSAWAGRAYYRLLAANTDAIHRFFEYKGQLYCATAPDNGGAGKVYMNGYRGAADSNSGDLDRLKDATTDFTGALLTGRIVKIVAGPGEEETQNWRVITGVGNGYVTVSPNWLVAHTVLTEYIILGADVWTERTSTGLTKPVTGIAEANGVLYFGQGRQAYGRIHREYNNGGAWSISEWGSTYNYFSSILRTHDPVRGEMLWTSIGVHSGLDKHTAVGYPVPLEYGSALIHQVTLDKNDAAWVASPNVTVTFSGGQNSISVADAFTTGVICYNNLPEAADVRGTNRVFLLEIKSSKALAANQLTLALDNTSGCTSPIRNINFPALAANQPYTVGGGANDSFELEFDAVGLDGAEAIASFGLVLNADVGAVVISVRGFVVLYDKTPPVELPGRPVAMEAYGSPETPWIILEDGFGSISSNQYAPAPIREMASVRSSENGLAHCVGGIYLYFNVGRNVQEFYDGNLRSIGPEIGVGLRSDCKGVPSCMVSYPGRIFVAIDGGYNNYSSVLVYQNSAWHELYRAPQVGRRIRSIFVQSIPGTEFDRLWISQGSDIVWVTVCMGSPYYNPGMTYNHEGYLETPWTYSELRNAVKQFNALEMTLENVFAASRVVTVDYKVDSDANAWAALPSTFDTIPSEKVNIVSTTPPTLTARRIKFRIKLSTIDWAQSPRVIASVLHYLGTMPTRYRISFLGEIIEGELSTTIEGEEMTPAVLGQFETAEAAWDQLVLWADNSSALTLGATYSVISGKTVRLRPPALRPTGRDFDEGTESHLVQFTLDQI